MVSIYYLACIFRKEEGMASKLDENIIKLTENQTKEEKNKTNNSTSDNSVSNSEETKTRVQDSDSEEQNRLYFRVFDGNIDILYRPAHQYIKFVKEDDEGITYIKSLLTMTREEFLLYLKENKMFKSVRKKERYSERNKHMEDWYKRAWSEQTYQFEKKHELVIPKEQIIYQEELVKIS